MIRHSLARIRPWPSIIKFGIESGVHDCGPSRVEGCPPGGFDGVVHESTEVDGGGEVIPRATKEAFVGDIQRCIRIWGLRNVCFVRIRI